jgi:hypothetical protein
MKYKLPAFTVPAVGKRDPKDCTHSWVRVQDSTCVLCGERVKNTQLHIPSPPPEAA